MCPKDIESWGLSFSHPSILYFKKSILDMLLWSSVIIHDFLYWQVQRGQQGDDECGNLRGSCPVSRCYELPSELSRCRCLWIAVIQIINGEIKVHPDYHIGRGFTTHFVSYLCVQVRSPLSENLRTRPVPDFDMPLLVVRSLHTVYPDYKSVNHKIQTRIVEQQNHVRLAGGFRVFGAFQTFG